MTELFDGVSAPDAGGADTERERRLFYGRIDDLSGRRDGGEVVFSSFLSPKEQHLLGQYLRRQGREDSVRFFGGFDGAERRLACFLPDYMEELLWDGADEKVLLGDYVKEALEVLEIRGSGYREITHRDVLGATLGLGVERDAIGDILLIDGDGNGREQPRVYLIVTSRIAPFLLSELKKIGSDSVRVRRGQIPADFVFTPRTRKITDTVASNRLDCVIGALVNTSRDKAQSLIRGGLVEVDYETEQRVDARLSTPCTLSVRGHGKFRLLSLFDVTRKGRLRLFAEQYL